MVFECVCVLLAEECGDKNYIAVLGITNLGKNQLLEFTLLHLGSREQHCCVRWAMDITAKGLTFQLVDDVMQLNTRMNLEDDVSGKLAMSSSSTMPFLVVMAFVHGEGEEMPCAAWGGMGPTLLPVL